jgi:arylsulfatase A-like enzyme
MTISRRPNSTSQLRLLAASVWIALGACSAPEPSAPVRQHRPNIVLVVADDHGRWAVGAYGNREVVTPNIDRLAAEGVLLRDAISPSPVCSPARASLLTGRLPSQHGIHDYISEEPEFERDWMAGEITLAELLQRAGYRTALIGKWHLSADSLPVARGFDRWVSYDVRRAGWQNQYVHRGDVYLSDQGEPVTVSGYQIEHLSKLAIEFVTERDRDVPFLLIFAPTETHAPFEGEPERWVARYRDARFVDVPRGEHSHLPPAAPQFVAPDDLRPTLAQYYAAVSFMDEQVGLLMDAIAARGELDRTLVVYTADQGHMHGQHGLVGKANATLPQNLYEESIAVPMVMRWPEGGLDGGRRLDLPFDHLDLFATLLAAAGVRLDGSERERIHSPGGDLLAALRDPSVPWRRFQFAEHGNARVVRDGRWKLVRRFPPLHPAFGDELYDLASDPRETVNLIDVEQERAAELAAVLDRHFTEYEIPERSGLRALELPAFNGREPWRRLAAALARDVEP